MQIRCGSAGIKSVKRCCVSCCKAGFHWRFFTREATSFVSTESSWCFGFTCLRTGGPSMEQEVCLYGQSLLKFVRVKW